MILFLSLPRFTIQYLMMRLLKHENRSLLPVLNYKEHFYLRYKINIIAHATIHLLNALMTL